MLPRIVNQGRVGWKQITVGAAGRGCCINDGLHGCGGSLGHHLPGDDTSAGSVNDGDNIDDAFFAPQR